MTTIHIKTASDLKYHVDERGSKFFTRNNMKFLGDTMRNYGVRKGKVYLFGGDTIDVIVLFRRRPVGEGVQRDVYFDAVTFRQVYGEEVPINKEED